MKHAILEKLSNGAEAFSPDGKWVLGRFTVYLLELK
jgi:hypothetical protein